MKKTLLILAGGMGSRFGGLKQIEPIGPNGEFLIHYSIYDAIKSGYNKIIFIIKEENYDVFKEKVGSKLDKEIEIHYVFQKNDEIKEKINIPEDRLKPLGTAHAIYCAKDIIKENFTIINADDFYGRESYQLLSDFMETSKNNFCIAGYVLGNTVTESGSVKRGVCIQKDSKLIELVESNIEKIEKGYKASALTDSRDIKVTFDTLVSMNMISFTPKLFDYIEENIYNFFNNNIDKIDKIEYLIPEVMNEMLQKKLVEISVIKTPAKWLGMTYKEDKDIVEKEIKDLIKKGIYPSILF
ncbi:MAG: sugar phosphate nucleotidyltransferase [Bacilli bacterium]|nr:sugar phosphate nucleotidyltransferase [Bacilli bacterium]